MRAALQVLRFGFLQNMRSRALLVFGGFFFVSTWIMLELQQDTTRAVAGLLQLMVLFVPLVGFIYGAVYVYNSREFIELLLVQPAARRTVYAGHFLGFTLPLAATFLLSAGLPFAWHGAGPDDSVLILLLVVGVLLLFITAALAYWIALAFDDRIKGLGVVLFVWLGFAFLYDGILLMMALLLEGYPLETPLLIAAVLNPLDLSRIAVLLRLDVAAFMGPTGAMFQKNLGTMHGTLGAFAALGAWVVIPLWFGLRKFNRKDF